MSKAVKHWTNGGTAVTNFRQDTKWIYERAIQAYDGGKRLYIGEPMGCYQGCDFALHDREHYNLNLSDFWRIFEAIMNHAEQPLTWKTPPKGWRLVTNSERRAYSMPRDTTVRICEKDNSDWSNMRFVARWDDDINEFNYAVPDDYQFTMKMTVCNAEGVLSAHLGKPVKII